MLLDTEFNKPDLLGLPQGARSTAPSSATFRRRAWAVFISHLQRLQDNNVKLVFFNMQEKVFSNT
ncbi:MAG: hypothetical protein WKG07_27900 [Hymenobacter sp.]